MLRLAVVYKCGKHSILLRATSVYNQRKSSVPARHGANNQKPIVAVVGGGGLPHAGGNTRSNLVTSQSSSVVPPVDQWAARSYVSGKERVKWVAKQPVSSGNGGPRWTKWIWQVLWIIRRYTRREINLFYCSGEKSLTYENKVRGTRTKSLKWVNFTGS